ncbi:tetratricopeptide repeat-containing [Ophiocordyceps camponoti-floridani]|uniref:Tetratricopeptide repeat-containing n=1 Tax=Ophiocordyceps camponoti-floridani TaxID=2030778 RepID=A0A8H4Q6A8_9HYPO|nr:tetratricopeptide repeat-containing [Ophiocordyceps camponoti-floridani]
MGKTVDEVWAELNKSPLFMTEMEENDDTAALQALSYEGTPVENAADFKERGNECFRVKGYVDAREFYAKGIVLLAAEEKKRTLDDDEASMLETLYVNRAACNLALGNHRSCYLDCAAALRLNRRNLKAYYRAARALLAVDRVRDAAEACAAGLTFDPENAPLKKAAVDVAARKDALEARSLETESRVARDRRRARLVAVALAARNVPPLRTSARPPDADGLAVALVPDPDDARSALAFPTVLLYPLQLESDVIKAFVETESLQDHLAYVLPPPWDQEREYGDVTCYIETLDGGLLKMGKRVALIEVLATGKVEIVDQMLRIYVLPAGKADGWVAEFKAQKAAQSGKSS